MNRPAPSARRSETLHASGEDPMGALLLRQRRVVARVNDPRADAVGVTPVTDVGEIARILAGCLLEERGDDDLVFELMMLESMLAANPVKSDKLLAELGSLGAEVMAGMAPSGMLDVAAIRRRTRRIRQNMGGFASRISAALMVFLTGLPMFAQEARAADEESFSVAAAPVVRVIDANSGQGMAGVQIKTMEERLLGVTDSAGQATLGDGYMETDLLSLEKDGYEMYLLDRGQLSSRNIVSMKPIGGAPAVAAAGASAASKLKPPTPPKVSHSTSGVPYLAAPKAPVKPAAPTIRLPVRPSPMAAQKVARVAAAAPAQRPPGMNPAAPVLDLPTVPAPPVVAHNPSVGSPREVAGATANKPSLTAYLGDAQAHPPAAHSKAIASLSMPARPRKPMAVPSKAHASGHRAAHVSIPRRMPLPRMNHGETGSYYRVRPGDTLSKIAQRTLGSAKRWPELYAMNKGRVINPAMIHAGQTLRVPGAGGGLSGQRYVVKPGDCLFSIASSQLGNGAKWNSLFQANRDRIRDARFIYPGQVLTLPPG